MKWSFIRGNKGHVAMRNPVGGVAESVSLDMCVAFISVGESLIPYCGGKWCISAGGEDVAEVWTKSNIVEFIITAAAATKGTSVEHSQMHDLQERQHSARLQVKASITLALSVGRAQRPQHPPPIWIASLSTEGSAVVETVKVTFAHRNPSLPVALAKPMLTVGLFHGLILRGCIGGCPNTPRRTAT